VGVLEWKESAQRIGTQVQEENGGKRVHRNHINSSQGLSRIGHAPIKGTPNKERAKLDLKWLERKK